MATKESVIRKPASDKDRFGDPTGTAPAQTIAGVVIFPRSSSEGATATNMVIDRIGMLLPPGSVVAPDDAFSVRGKDYAVEGEPYDTRKKGILVYLTGVVQGG